MLEFLNNQRIISVYLFGLVSCSRGLGYWRFTTPVTASTGPVTRSKSQGITNLVSEPLVMTNQSEEFMKKLEAFMTQQTQSTSELKAAVEALQAKQATLEEGLSARSHNKSNKQGGSEASVEEEIEMESFDDPPEQSQGRGRGTGFETRQCSRS
ncbi:unnamed protein product [Lactuca saligna]|uniref:Uncharacterized protein n=1 Tax=Lactuca saligna TaxID=75948 RepID=A0AA35XZU7_LACSI|nr:unnamed protein product [Lactuca saligna]